MEVSERIAYHLEELKTARTPSSEHHIMPDVRNDDLAILDVGCGIGQTLVSLDLDSNHSLVGVDIEQEALVYGRNQYASVNYANCTAESLPFQDDSFDLVISRVALPYTNIPESLAEMQRVLRPGGRVWITLHPMHMTLRQLRDSIKRLKVKDVVFRCYVLLNGTLFHLLGKQLPFPINGKYESFQTSSSTIAALERTGFENLNVQRGRHFLVTGEKPL